LPAVAAAGCAVLVEAVQTTRNSQTE